jgi:hypothetical protein
MTQIERERLLVRAVRLQRDSRICADFGPDREDELAAARLQIEMISSAELFDLVSSPNVADRLRNAL